MSTLTRLNFGDSPIRSLHWDGEDLVDFLAGGRRLRPDGTLQPPLVFWAFPFDRIVVSPTGRFQVLYSDYGTKGVVAEGARHIREINRSYYCAATFEYPVCLLKIDGREVLAHCPDEYWRIEIEDVETGERLTVRHTSDPLNDSPTRNDEFRSRMRATADGRYVFSAGWLWHPVGVCHVYSTKAAILDADTLDGHGIGPSYREINGEVEGACWLDDDRLLISTSDKEVFDSTNRSGLQPLELGIWSVSARNWTSRVPIAQPLGALMAIGAQVLSLLEHPKIIDPLTGQVVERWTDIRSGSQSGSIRTDSQEPTPPFAVDPLKPRLAIAGGNDVFILDLSIR